MAKKRNEIHDTFENSVEDIILEDEHSHLKVNNKNDDGVEDYEGIEEKNNEPQASQEEFENIIKDLEDSRLRLQADYDNYRKRTQKEHILIKSRANKDMMQAILPVVDNFERALMSAVDPEDAFVRGVDMVYKQLIAELEKQGLSEITAVGEYFDPNYHNAVAQVASESESGRIIEVYQKGYFLHKEVIRPSMVVVAE